MFISEMRRANPPLSVMIGFLDRFSLHCRAGSTALEALVHVRASDRGRFERFPWIRGLLDLLNDGYGWSDALRLSFHHSCPLATMCLLPEASPVQAAEHLGERLRTRKQFLGELWGRNLYPLGVCALTFLLVLLYILVLQPSFFPDLDIRPYLPSLLIIPILCLTAGFLLCILPLLGIWGSINLPLPGSPWVLMPWLEFLEDIRLGLSAGVPDVWSVLALMEEAEVPGCRPRGTRACRLRIQDYLQGIGSIDTRDLLLTGMPPELCSVFSDALIRRRFRPELPDMIQLMKECLNTAMKKYQDISAFLITILSGCSLAHSCYFMLIPTQNYLEAML